MLTSFQIAGRNSSSTLVVRACAAVGMHAMLGLHLLSHMSNEQM